MVMYKKPWIIETDDLAEGIYAASGAESITWTAGSKSVYSSDNGQFAFNISLPAAYVNKHIKLTVIFDRQITNAWGMNANPSINGTTAILNIWSAPETGTITAAVPSSEVNIVSISADLIN